jgi:phosphoribosylformylglycinamidine synthase
MTARVYVTLKKGVLDPQGSAVARSLKHIGFPEVESVRVGKFIEIQLGAESPAQARARLEEMCKKLIANTVIEDFRIELDGEGA